MAGDRVAVVGVGQTVHRTARKDVSMAGLVREAAQEALDDAGMTWSDIDDVVIGKVFEDHVSASFVMPPLPRRSDIFFRAIEIAAQVLLQRLLVRLQRAAHLQRLQRRRYGEAVRPLTLRAAER